MSANIAVIAVWLWALGFSVKVIAVLVFFPAQKHKEIQQYTENYHSCLFTHSSHGADRF